MLANDGTSMVLVRGSINQEIKNLEPGSLYRVTFVTTYNPFQGSTLANKEGFVNFAGERQDRHVFLLYTKGYRYDNHISDSREILSWHRHTFYHTAQQTSEVLTIGSLDEHTGLLIDNIQVHKVSSIINNSSLTSNNTVHSHIVFLHDWGSVHAAWRFMENESQIVDYTWCIGMFIFISNCSVELKWTTILHLWF